MLCLMAWVSAKAQTSTDTTFADTLRGLQKDIYLHPANSNTAYTLRKGECVYNQAPRSLPLPSWAWIGITDWLTAEIDLLPLVGGLFVEPHLPVPSFNFRFRLKQQQGWKPALAYETMFQYLYRDIDQSGNPYFATWRRNASWYNRVNASWQLNTRFHIHASVGCTYADYLRLENKDSLHPQEQLFRKRITPDLSLGLDYRFSWISLHATISQGTTFNYLDNVPRKFEVMYGVRLAPFYKNRFGFLRCFRMEWTGFYVAFRDVDADAYVPVFIPYVYWQWRFGKKQ